MTPEANVQDSSNTKKRTLLGLQPDKTLSLALVVGILASVVSVPFIVKATRSSISSFPELVPLMFVLGSTLTCVFSWVRYPSNAAYLRITLAGCSLLIGLNVLWLGFDFPIVHERVYDGVAPLFPFLPAIALLSGVAALFRPAFALITSIVFLIQKQLVISMAGGQPGFSHYLVIVDTMIFIAVGIVMFSLIRQVYQRSNGDGQSLKYINDNGSEYYYLTLMCVAIGVHFGNYFLSGIGKILLDGGIFSWILENKTHYTMLAGYNIGSAPLSFSEQAFGFAYTWLSNSYVALNLLVAFFQTLCFVAFLRKKLMIVWVLSFDIMHIAIFTLTGALFVHWIVLNFLLVLSVARMPENLAPRGAIAMGIIATTIGHLFFNTQQMAWYDNRQVRDARFVALYEDGSEAFVPPSFFRESAYGFYNRWFNLPTELTGRVQASELNNSVHGPADKLRNVEWPVQSGAWGQVATKALMDRGENCGLPEGPGIDRAIDFDLSAVETFVRARHDWVLQRIEQGRPLRYHLFPHDHFSMPWRFKEFESSDPRNIIGYYYQVETVCLAWEDGALKREILTRTVTQPFMVNEDAS